MNKETLETRLQELQKKTDALKSKLTSEDKEEEAKDMRMQNLRHQIRLKRAGKFEGAF